MTETYDLYAIWYCTNPRRRRQEYFMQLPPGDPHDGPMPIDFFVWVAKSDKRTILIDSGADEAMCRTRGHDLLRCSTERLKLVGHHDHATHGLTPSLDAALYFISDGARKGARRLC